MDRSARFALLYFFWGLLGSAFSLLVPVYLANRGISNTEIGLLMGSASLALFAASVPAGILSDRLNPKLMLAAGFLFTLPFYYLITLTTSMPILFAFFAASGLAGSLFSVSADSALYRTFRASKGQAFGIVHAALQGGVILGLLLSSYVIAQLGFRAHALLLAVAGAVGLLISLVIPTPAGTQPAHATHAPRAYLSEFTKGKFLLFAFAMFLLAFHWGTERTSFPLYASRELGFGDATLGVFFALNIIIFGVGGLLAGRLVDVTKNRYSLFILALVLSAAGSILYAASYDFGSALLSRFLHDIGDAMIAVLAMYALSGISAKEKVGGAVGAIALVYAIATFFGAFVSGALNDAAGYSFAIVFSAALTLLSAATVAVSVRLRLLEDPFA